MGEVSAEAVDDDAAACSVEKGWWRCLKQAHCFIDPLIIVGAINTKRNNDAFILFIVVNGSFALF